jgi:hypothetical protein
MRPSGVATSIESPGPISEVISLPAAALSSPAHNNGKIRNTKPICEIQLELALEWGLTGGDITIYGLNYFNRPSSSVGIY